jgi:mRNA-degrading endonuclease RelE of RelBE toxin-antitoxin system
MNYEIKTTSRFEEDVSYYVKKRKFKHIIDDVEKIINKLKSGNLVGEVIPDLKINKESHTYKVRVANTDTNVGKSNGYRLIYYAIQDDYIIYLVTIYYKKDDNIIPSNDEIAALVKEYCI